MCTLTHWTHSQKCKHTCTEIQLVKYRYCICQQFPDISFKFQIRSVHYTRTTEHNKLEHKRRWNHEQIKYNPNIRHLQTDMAINQSMYSLQQERLHPRTMPAIGYQGPVTTLIILATMWSDNRSNYIPVRNSWLDWMRLPSNLTPHWPSRAVHCRCMIPCGDRVKPWNIPLLTGLVNGQGEDTILV